MNIASAFKSEISRIARKEIRGETQPLKKSSSQHRSELAALKRRIAELEGMVKRLAKQAGRVRPTPDGDVSAPQMRFSAKSIASQRKRLGLSAADFGGLIGVSAQSIYHWEQGKSRPRASQMAAIHAVRKLGRREAAAQLAGQTS